MREGTNQNNRAEFVLTECIPYIGVVGGWHKVVECPDHCADQFTNSIWIIGVMRPEPVRVLDYEIIEKR